MNKSIIYPPKNSTIIFKEPFFRKELSGRQVKYYIKAVVDDMPEQEIRVTREQQRETMDYLLKSDMKLTNAVVGCDNMCQFKVVLHSPQKDFFGLVKEEKNS